MKYQKQNKFTTWILLILSDKCCFQELFQFLHMYWLKVFIRLKNSYEQAEIKLDLGKTDVNSKAKRGIK